MSAKKQLEKEIRESCVFLREKNMIIPSETIQYILEASLEKLNKTELEFNADEIIHFLESCETIDDAKMFANEHLR